MRPARRPVDRVRATAARLTWGTLPGSAVDDDTRELLRTGLGGIVLFSRSIGGRDAVRRLVAELRREAAGPLHVSVDQEGGQIVRLRDGFTAFPGAMAIGAAGSSELAFEVARASAVEMAGVGIDVVLAPVLDLAIDLRNPTVGARSFGSSPAHVARLGAATVRGYLAGGVLPVPKHFPGHGRTPHDTHTGRVVAVGDGETLRRDLHPFETAIEAGAALLMASHVRYPGMGDELPASISPSIVRLARDRLGFGGVLITDAMVMDAITVDRSVPEACVRSLAAGLDIVMALEPARKVVEEVARAVDDGRLAEGVLEAALARVVGLAAEDPPLGPAAAPRSATLGDESSDERRDAVLARHAGLADRVARASLTLAWGGDQLPIDPATSVLLVDLPGRAISPIEDRLGDQAGTPMAAALATRFPRLLRLAGDAGEPGWTERVLAAAGTAEMVIVATRDAFVGQDERAFLRKLADVGRPVVRIALHSPADLALPGRPDVAIAAYSDVPATAVALADALAVGRRAFPGRLPVRLPGALPDAPRRPAPAAPGTS